MPAVVSGSAAAAARSGASNARQICSQGSTVAAGRFERPMPDRDPSDGTSVTRVAWDGCSPGTSVTLYRVEGGGHSLPGRPSLAPRLLGLTNFDISGPAVILDAFIQSNGRML